MPPGADTGFFKGGGGGWCLVVAESMGHVPKIWQFEKWNLLEIGRYILQIAEVACCMVK